MERSAEAPAQDDAAEPAPPKRPARRLTLILDAELYDAARAAADHYQRPLAEWVMQAMRDKLAAEPTRPVGEPDGGPVRTPFVESGVTTRDTKSSAG